MSIQSSINQMLSSIANQQLYKGLTKGIENIKTEVGNVGTEVSKTKKAIQKQTKSQAAGAYKQNQALAALMTQNQGTPQLTPDNAPEAPKSEDTPWTVGEPTSYQSPHELSTEDYVDQSVDPDEFQQMSETILEQGGLERARDLAAAVRQGQSYQAAVRQYLIKDAFKEAQESIAQRLQKAKAERSQSKQEFLKNKGGKHR